MMAQHNGLLDSSMHSTVDTTATDNASQKASYSLFNLTTPAAKVSGSVAESKIAGGAIVAGVLVPLIIISVITVMIILYKKGKWKPSETWSQLQRMIGRDIDDNDEDKSKGRQGRIYGRRRSDKVAICENEVSQSTSGIDKNEAFCNTIDERHVNGGYDPENEAFCQSISERNMDENQSISYTLSEDCQYDELNKSARRHIVKSDIVETYQHINRLPPDLEAGYDKADANALFPLRNTFPRPVSDSHNTYSHMAGKRTEVDNDKAPSAHDLYDNEDNLKSAKDDAVRTIEEDENNEDDGSIQTNTNDIMADEDSDEHQDGYKSDEVDDYDDNNEDEIYDTAMADIIRSRSQK